MKTNSLFLGAMLSFFSIANTIASENVTANALNPSTEMAAVEDVFPFTAGSEWRYNDSGTDLGTAWRNTDYDDSAWAVGAGQLGYGDNDEATVLSYGPDANNKYPTYYFRYSFENTGEAQYGSFNLSLLFDDGAVVYLNGAEIMRRNLPNGEIVYTTLANGAISGSDEDDYDVIDVEAVLLEGTNTFAVEMHQSSVSSSDMSFDFAASFTPLDFDPAPYPVAAGASWSYLDTGVSLDAEAWNTAAYNNDAWAIGAAPLGYGDPVNTTISYGPDPNNKYITTYFSREVMMTLDDVSDEVVFGLNRDDGAIVYVNGVEVIRDNMPAGAIDYLTHSSTTVSGADEDVYFIHNVDKSFFVEGVNIIAVELHNRDGNSSDLKFDMYMQNTPDPVDPFVCEEGDIACFTSIVPTGQTSNMIIAPEHRFQVIVKQGDAYTTGDGEVGGNNDFTGYIPIEGSSTLGYVSVNHETTPGGVTIADVNFNDETLLWEITETQAVDFFNDALVTTTRNCSGGITPWGTIITAEESSNAGDDNMDGYQDVGWLVEIDPETATVIDYGNGQEKLWAMGKMNHENVVVHEDMKTAYYGEDGGTDCVYKFVADTAGDLSEGTLYVLKLDAPLVNNDPTSTTAEWIQVPNTTEEERNNVIYAAEALGGTNFNGVEDCEINPLTGEIYFTSKGKSRVYKFTDDGATVSNFETFVGGMSYDITTPEGVFNESWGGGNDNLTFDDKGNLWVLQDGGNNYIWVVRPNHRQDVPNVELFASMPNGSEPTGLTFTPDFKYGFFSVQHPSGNNTPQLDASFNEVVFDASTTIVFALNENLGLQAPVSDFTASVESAEPGTAITFTDISANNPTSWSWTFEGGIPATSTEQSPVVAYLEEGVFNVSLSTSNQSGTGDTQTKENFIEILLLGVNTLLEDNIAVYPNPTNGIVNIEIVDQTGAEISVTAFDVLGRELLTSTDVQNLGSKQVVTLDLVSALNNNPVIMLKVNVGSNSGTYKIVRK
ncbi:Twin-arginine translocation pathway signal [unidentified eubacterium SCB49]|nr:Twin-arginine translocation pathway signal [unidentified eubacterium SCB49]